MVSRKPSAKKVAAKAAKKPSAKKTTAKRATAKTTAKKAVKKTAARKTTGKATTKKKAVKKTVKKAAAKKTVKTAAKKASGKKSVKKAAARKTTKQAAGKTTTKKTVKKAVAAKKTAKKVAKKTAAKKSVKKSVKKSAKKSVKKSAKKSGKKTVATKRTRKASGAQARGLREPVESEAGRVAERQVEARAIRDATDAVLQALEEEASRSSEALTEHDRLEATKYEVELAEKRGEPAGPPPAPRELDEAYGETELRVLVRDPQWVFAYWEVSDEDRRARNFESKTPAIRWYDVTDLPEFTGDNAHHTFDTEVNHMARCWYQKMPDAGRVWCAELGVYEGDGGFTAVARSPFTSTPPRSVAPQRAVHEWMYVAPSGFPQIFEVPLGMSVAEALGRASRRGVAVPDEVLRAAIEEGGVTPRFSARLILSGIADEVLQSLASDAGASLSFRELFPWVFSEDVMEWILSSGELAASDSLYHSEGLAGERKK